MRHYFYCVRYAGLEQKYSTRTCSAYWNTHTCEPARPQCLRQNQGVAYYVSVAGCTANQRPRQPVRDRRNAINLLIPGTPTS